MNNIANDHDRHDTKNTDDDKTLKAKVWQELRQSPLRVPRLTLGTHACGSLGSHDPRLPQQDIDPNKY